MLSTKKTDTDFRLKNTNAPIGSIEHYGHYKSEWLRLNSIVVKVPIKDRSELCHELEEVEMVLEQYEPRP